MEEKEKKKEDDRRREEIVTEARKEGRKEGGKRRSARIGTQQLETWIVQFRLQVKRAKLSKGPLVAAPRPEGKGGDERRRFLTEEIFFFLPD